MKLYLVHCGFYDKEIVDGIYEMHVNLFVAAESFDDAKLRAKLLPEFKAKKMHVDGLQEITAVSGYQIKLEEDLSLHGESRVHGSRFRELAPPSPPAG